jgi:hypothetical protein
MEEAELLVDVNRVVGVLIAVVGSVVVAPAGTRLLLGSSWAWLYRLGSRARDRLLQALPFLRGATTIQGSVVVLEPADLMLSAGTVTLSGRGWTPSSSVTARVEALRQYIIDVDDRLSRVAGQLRKDISDGQAAIAKLDRALEAEAAELRRLLDERDRESARIDARGLPVIGFGVVLSGVPEVAASLPWHLGWLLPLLGVAAAGVAIGHAVREHRSQMATRRSR